MIVPNSKLTRWLNPVRIYYIAILENMIGKLFIVAVVEANSRYFLKQRNYQDCRVMFWVMVGSMRFILV